VQRDGTTMKKKYLLLLAAIGVISVSVFVWFAVLSTQSRVTKANLGRVRVGMSYGEVVDILGEMSACLNDGLNDE
jgi:hypothetical protein